MQIDMLLKLYESKFILVKLNGMISILVICLVGHRKGVQLRKRCRDTNTDLRIDLRGSFVVPENKDYCCYENCYQSKNLY